MRYNLIASLVIVALFSITLASAENLHYWFDNSLADSSGNGLTLSGSANFTTGKINQAVNVSAIFTSAISNTNINLSNANFSLTFWINTTQTGQTGVIGTNNILGPDLGTWSIRINRPGRTGAISFLASSPTVEMHSASSSITNGGWHHIAYVRESGTLKIYVDGALENSTSVPNNFSVTGFGFNVGEITPFGGFLDDVRLFKGQAITQNQVSLIYNGGVGTQTTLSSIQNIIPTLNSPSNNFVSSTGNITFNSSALANNINLTNATLYIWNSNNTIINRTTNIVAGTSNSTIWILSNITLGNYIWNARFCGLNSSSATICSFAQSNSTFTAGIFTEEFEPTLIEGQSTNINLNITFDGVDPNILALLYWNNTQSTPSKQVINSTRVRFMSNFLVPLGTGNATGVNISHYWRFYLPDNSLNDTTTPQLQTVYSFGIDNCTSFSTVLINYTFYDEDTRTLINGPAQNTSLEVEVLVRSVANLSQYSNFSRTYSDISSAVICISQIGSGFTVDSQARYTADEYAVEYFNTQNTSLSASNFPKNISLYLLRSTNAQEFQITYRDGDFLPVSDAVIEIERQYLGGGGFIKVEAPKTDSEGQTIGNFVLNDIVYNIIVSKNGQTLATFLNKRAFCEDVQTGNCVIELNERTGTTQIQTATEINGVRFTPSYNQTSRTYTIDFTVISGENKNFLLNITKFDAYQNTSLCSNSLTASSGTLTCTLSISFANFTGVAQLYADNQLIYTDRFDISGLDVGTYGKLRFILALMLLLTLVGASISDKSMIVLSCVVGVILAVALYLVDSGGYIGTTTSVVWLVIMAVILLLKLNRENA